MLNLYNYYTKSSELIQGTIIYSPKIVINFIKAIINRFNEQSHFRNNYIFTDRSKDDILFAIRITAEPKDGKLIDWVDISLKQEPGNIKLYVKHKNENIMNPINAFEDSGGVIDILGVAHMVHTAITDCLE